jgi:hypothetical protein
MKKELTPEEIEQFIAAKRRHDAYPPCPFCGDEESYKIHGYDVFDGEHGTEWVYHILCHRCGAQWDQKYRLDEVVIVKGPVDGYVYTDSLAGLYPQVVMVKVGDAE